MSTFRETWPAASLTSKFLFIVWHCLGYTLLQKKICIIGNENLIVQIYGPIAKGIRSEKKVADVSSEPVKEIDSTFKQTLEQFLIYHGCIEPVEPELTRMAYRARQNQRVEDVAIVFVGDDITCSEVVRLRRRGLNEATPRNQLKRLGIYVQTVSNLVPPVHSVTYKPDVEPAHYQSENFERAVCIKLQEMFDCQIRDSIPLEQLGLGKQEDIDVYLVKCTEDPIKSTKRKEVWIGECRLYREGKEGEQIEDKKIEQLRKRLPEVQKYEKHRSDCSSEVEIKGVLISNACYVDRRKWEWLVSEMDKYGIQVFFYQAILNRGWANSGGRLKITNLKSIESPFDESSHSE